MLTKIKNNLLQKIKKGLILTFLAFVLLFPTASITHAQDATFTCPNNFTRVDTTNKCSTNRQVACPDGWTKVESESTNRVTVCQKVDTDSEAALSAESQQTIKSTTQIIIDLQKFLNSLLWPVLVITGGLLDNSLLFGSGMEERLREIWIPIRNIVNILFVIALVGIALYNVLGIGEEGGEYSLKNILPKLVIGIIAVNFSFLGIKVILDAVNVITVSIFALPNQVDQGLSVVLNSDNPDDAKIVKHFCALSQGRTIKEVEERDNAALSTEIIAEVNLLLSKRTLTEMNVSFPAGASAADIESVKSNLSAGQKDEFDRKFQDKKRGQLCSGLALSDQGVLFLRQWSSQNAALAMALNMTDIVFLQQVPDSVANLEKLFINSLFSLLLYIVYAASFIALFIVLLARLVVMWLSIAISPVLLLAIAVPAVKEKITGFDELTQQFTKNAIAPLGIALSMTIGWIMLNALQDVANLDSQSTLNLTIGLPVVGMETIQDIVVGLGTVGIVWLGVFTAASESLAAGVTDWMKEGLLSAGKWVGTLPLKHTPLVPIKLPGADEEKRYTLESVGDFVSRIGDNSTRRDQLFRDITGQTAPSTLQDLSNPNKVEGNEEGVKKAYALLDNHYGKLGDQKTHKLLEKIYNTRRRDLIEKMDPRVRDAFAAYITDPDANHKRLSDEIRNQHNANIKAGTAPQPGGGNNNNNNAGQGGNQNPGTTPPATTPPAGQRDPAQVEQVKGIVNNSSSSLQDVNTAVKGLEAKSIDELKTILGAAYTNLEQKPGIKIDELIVNQSGNAAPGANPAPQKNPPQTGP